MGRPLPFSVRANYSAVTRITGQCLWPPNGFWLESPLKCFAIQASGIPSKMTAGM